MLFNEGCPAEGLFKCSFERKGFGKGALKGGGGLQPGIPLHQPHHFSTLLTIQFDGKVHMKVKKENGRMGIVFSSWESQEGETERKLALTHSLY